MKKVAIIEWIKLPENLKDLASDNHRFHNDCFIELYFNTSSKAEILGYFEEDKANGEDWTFGEWLERECDLIEDWLYYTYCEEQGIDLEGADLILLEICW